MADHVAIAGLLADIAGAILLARAVAFEGADEYVSGTGTTRWAGTGGTDVGRDFERAEDGAEARIGAILLGVGFVGQAIGAARADWSTPAAVVAYAAAALAIVAGWRAVPRVRSRRERDIFLAHLDAMDGDAEKAAEGRRGIFDTYSRWFEAVGRSETKLDEWGRDWERRHGRHPWHPEQGPPDADAPR